MDTKDTLGEKLRLQERAAEDRYFAERDRELIAKLKHTQEAEHEQMIRELARGRCPQCGERLHEHPIHGEMIDECPTCRGVWLSRTKLAVIPPTGREEWVGRFLEGLGRLIEP